VMAPRVGYRAFREQQLMCCQAVASSQSLLQQVGCSWLACVIVREAMRLCFGRLLVPDFCSCTPSAYTVKVAAVVTAMQEALRKLS
jgi:hypothetical protein